MYYKGSIGKLADLMVAQGGMDPDKVKDMPLEDFLEESLSVIQLWNTVGEILQQEELKIEDEYHGK
jgi:hypothetical protein